MEYRKKAISSIKWVTVATVVNYGLQFVLFIILARYLSKPEIGLMSLAQVVVDFSSYFIDMGFSNIIIHKQEISHRQLSSLYWLNISAGIIIFIAIFILSPYLASFYNEPGLNNLLKLVGVSFLIIPWGQQHKTLLQKELKFDAISKIEMISRALSIVLAIIMILKGAGVYALAYMLLSGNVISTAMLLYVGFKTHRPSFIFAHRELKGMYSFGMYQMGERTLNYFSGQFDTIIIGKMLGTSALGLYTVAKNLVMRPQQIINPIVTRVAFPMLAKVQEDNSLLKKTYVSTINYLSSVNFPVHLGIFILAGPLTRILCGDSWDQAIILVKILAIFAMLRSVFNPVGTLLLAKGRADLGFYWVIFFSIITPPTIYLGGLWGLQGVCYAQVVLMLITFFPFYIILIKRLINAKFWEYHYAVVLPLVISAAACILPFMLEPYFNNYIVKMFLVSLTGLIVYFLLSVRFNKDFINLMKSFISI